MIKFTQKNYSKEGDAMRPFNEALKAAHKRVEIIGMNSLLPILKGNNIVIERFVIHKPTFGSDKYRMYLKIGAKVKMPENVILASQYTTHTPFLNTSLKMSGGLERRKLFGNNNNNNNGGGGGQFINASTEVGRASIDITKTHRLGETIIYDTKSRSLVLEFPSIENAVRALDILPFGLSYKLYLLDA